MTRSPAILAMAAVAAAAQFGCASEEEAATGEAKSAAKGRINSSIAEGAQLADPLRWTARVTGVAPGQVISVRFLIDGQVAHVEREAPYVFGGRGNLLIPGTLGRGSHTLGVDALLRGGRRRLDGQRLSASSGLTAGGGR